MPYNCTSVPGERPQPMVSSFLTQQFDAPKVPQIPYWELTTKIFFFIVAFVMDIVGNTLVVAIICLNRKMHTSTNVLILNLAISDLLVGLFCMWVQLGNDIDPDWPFGPFMCKFSYFIQEIALASSVLTLSTISIERSLAILMPLKGKMSKTTTSACICINWTLAVAVAAPYLVYKKQMEVQWRDRKQVWCDETWPKYYIDRKCTIGQPRKRVYYIIQCVVMYFVPVVIMIVTYVLITVTLLKRKAPGVVMESTRAAQEKTRRKVNRMLIIILAVFIVCWTPQQALVLWSAFREIGEKIPKFIKPLQYATLYIAFFNSSINPVLYGGLNENFRRGFKEAFKCLLWKKRNQIHPGNPKQTSKRKTEGQPSLQRQRWSNKSEETRDTSASQTSRNNENQKAGSDSQKQTSPNILKPIAESGSRIIEKPKAESGSQHLGSQTVDKRQVTGDVTEITENE